MNTDAETSVLNLKFWSAWFHTIDLLAPSTVNPAPFAAEESAAPLATKIFKSATLSVLVSNAVWVPCTVKFPNTVTFELSNVIAVSKELVNEFSEVLPFDAVNEFNSFNI